MPDGEGKVSNCGISVRSYAKGMFRKIIVVCALAFSICAAETNSSPALSKELEPLKGLLGTWKGNFIGGKAEKPMGDVVRFERVLNGRAIRAVHSVNDGIYGGETLIVWNAGKKRIETFYFTTEGDRTVGVMETKGGNAFTTIEKLEGAEPKEGAEAVTEVRATSKILPDGTLHVKSEYLKKGEWQAGHEIIYKQEPGAELIFK
jgi:hypothetical protein